MMNRVSWLILAISAGMAWAAVTSPAMADDVTAVAAPAQPAAAIKMPERPPVIVALTTCTRVGNRMVC